MTRRQPQERLRYLIRLSHETDRVELHETRAGVLVLKHFRVFEHRVSMNAGQAGFTRAPSEA